MGGSKNGGVFNSDGLGKGWLPDLNKLPGMPGSYNQVTAGAPAPAGWKPPEENRADLRKAIAANQNLDEIARNDLLKQFDEGSLTDPVTAATTVAQKFSTMLDPETAQGKELIARKARMDLIKEQPGLRKQTTFLSSSGSDSYLGSGGR